MPHHGVLCQEAAPAAFTLTTEVSLHSRVPCRHWLYTEDMMAALTVGFSPFVWRTKPVSAKHSWENVLVTKSRCNTQVIRGSSKLILIIQLGIGEVEFLARYYKPGGYSYGLR